MAKKNKNLPAVEGEVVNAALQDAQLGSAPQPKQKKDKNKTKKPNVFQRMGRALKEMFSEMKKVTWLKPSDTVKRWGVVLLVVLIFLVVITGFDALCNWLLKLLINPSNVA